MPAYAQDAEALAARVQLDRVVRSRPDLQTAFPDGNGTAVMVASGMPSIEDWARRYGYKEYPEILVGYRPAAKLTPALLERKAALTPIKNDGSEFDFSTVTAHSILVIDVGTRRVLLSYRADEIRSLASITKLMTALVATDRSVPESKLVAMAKEDEVGGAKLNVRRGIKVPFRDLFYSMLVGSANNAASAVARSTGLPRKSFVEAMNQRAEKIGLNATTFVDPTGIKPANVSTARDVAALSFEAFDQPMIQRATTTSKYGFTLARQVHTIKNTDHLLTNETNGLVVMGGKTGYLEESMWNLTVQMQAEDSRPLQVVILGSSSYNSSFSDAETAARWVWAHYRWGR
ncbi:MAG: serine hydrolase [Patescibacteria group bacterium]